MKSSQEFPSGPRRWLALARLIYIRFSKKIKLDFGPFRPPVDTLSLLTCGLFSSFGAYHYGEVLTIAPGRLTKTQSLERELILNMVSLYGGSGQVHNGMVMSGASEANIYMLWLGREHMRKQHKHAAMLIATDLTHESIINAANMMDIPIRRVSLDHNFGMLPAAFVRTVQYSYARGCRGFYVCATLGYKQTGTSDDIERLIISIRQLYESLRGIEIFLWVDAASDGLIRPFVDAEFRPLASPYVQAIIADFHKYGYVPIPAAVMLLRRHLVDRAQNYQQHGLLESRSALPALVSWAAIEDLGISGFRKKAFACQALRAYFLQQVTVRFPFLRVISPETNCSVLLIYPAHFFRRFKRLENIFSIRCYEKILLVANRRQLICFSKIYFLPQQSRRDVERMIEFLSQEL